MSKAFEASGGSQVLADHCIVQVNSASSGAVVFSGNSTLNSGENCFVGGVSQGLSLMSPSSTPGCAAKPDPFATYAAPAVGPCDFTSFKVSGGKPESTSA